MKSINELGPGKLFCALGIAGLLGAGCANGSVSSSAGTNDETVSSSSDSLFFGLFPRPLKWHRHDKLKVDLGPRPYYLIDNMDESKLKDKLQSCSEDTMKPSDFSIGHRGAALQFPEHTKESYQAAGRMGAGIIECDVTFTKDRQLVCRHSQCDLHTTTNILSTPLAAKCSKPFTPANPATNTPASAQCCTSDITLAEFKTLCGKMDGANPAGTTVAAYMDGTPNFRTDLYATCGTLVTHAESIDLIDSMGRKFTPELKAPGVAMPFEGSYTQAQYAQQMIDEYKAAHIDPRRVWPQSFNLNDVAYWLKNEPRFGKQGVYLDDRVDAPGGYDLAVAGMSEVRAKGVNIIAPPMWALVTTDGSGKIVPSSYAKAAKKNGLDLITWTLERSGPLAAGGGYYFQSVTSAINNDGDTYVMLDVLAKQVGVLGVFSDWPATVTYYANCMGM